MSKPEVHEVVVEINPPSRKEPAGRTTRGHFIMVDGLLTMTDPHGHPAPDGDGKIYTHTLEPADNPRVIASRLTKALYNALRGPRPNGFGGSGGTAYGGHGSDGITGAIYYVTY